MDMFFNKLTDVCHNLLYKDKKLWSYLKQRNLSDETIKKYKLGAFPKDLRILLNKMYPKELVNRGILWNASNSPFKYKIGNQNIHYPVVIPIRDTKNNTVAIGCRTLMSDEERKKLGIPKYKNSEYKKTAFLFGLDKAKESIIQKNKVYVVEGYFDVIASHQAGIKNVVGTCGTLFSKRHLIILSRYTNNIVILFDNDEPGRLSSKCIIDKFSNQDILDISFSCRFTPKGYKDIDEYLCRGGELDFLT